MNTTTTTKAGAVLGAALLVGTAGAAGVIAATDSVSPAFAQESTVSTSTQETSSADSVKASGSFSFTQNCISSTSQIREVFSKAASALCASLPEYACAVCGSPLIVSGPQGPIFEGTLDQASDEGETSLVIGCSCATNVAGGGAIVNAEVSGVDIATLVGKLAR